MRSFMRLKALTLTVIAILEITQPTSAATIDTFDFTQTGWRIFSVGRGLGALDPGSLLSGSFTGTVEPMVSSRQGDLTSFSAVRKQKEAGADAQQHGLKIESTKT